MTEKFTRASRRLTVEQKQEYDEIRRKAKEDFPPLEPASGPSEKGRIALAIRDARKAQGLTFEQLAERSGVCDAETVRDIEYGSDAKLSDVAALAHALGLRLELVAEIS
ncbi:MAG: helix-turn-helix domain-containing protein [Planctomycetes bacterium]|nr:helix-turn-helix domain-containing protein [Planctomycetota bacterium]MBL7037353.1 helix-turn-helix domain-containing protein [Pirellulaceae bacterium]